MGKFVKKIFVSVLLTLGVILGASLLWPEVYGVKEIQASEAYPHETKEDGKWVREVTSWDDMDIAFQNIPLDDEYRHRVTVRLTTNLSMSAQGLANDALYMKRFSIPWGTDEVRFDFNGHKLIGTDDISSTNTNYKLADFIHFFMVGASTLIFEDSVGGGGIEFYSSRALDTNNLSALIIEGVGTGNIGEDFSSNTVIFNGGTYKLTAKTAKIGVGTLDYDVYYRGAVISDHVKTIINDGNFIAKSEGLVSSGTDFCGRELTAFGTVVVTMINFVNSEFTSGLGVANYNTVINGGVFTSDGYSIHHFDNCRMLFEGDPKHYNKWLYKIARQR